MALLEVKNLGISFGGLRAVELGGKGPVCALGTLYFSGDVRKAFAELVKG